MLAEHVRTCACVDCLLLHRSLVWLQALQVVYSEREVGGEVGLPHHWMRDFFLASLCLEVQENQEGLSRLQVSSCTSGLSVFHCKVQTRNLFKVELDLLANSI